MSYEESSSPYQSGYIGNEVSTGKYGVAFSEGNQESAAQGSYSNYGSISTTDYGAGMNDALLTSGGGASDEYYSSSSYSGVGADAQTSSSGLETGFEQQNLSGTFAANNAGYSSSTFEQQSSSSTAYATDDQGLYKDPNPEVIRRPAPGGTQTYTQRILVRFLQPPAVPPPGPLIIKEIRPPQPPPPPPLYIRQRPPPPPKLPPLVIREAPPKMPPAVGTQVITKMLPALPVPPRSVIIERLPPLPPKPRDVIVERWLPYKTQQKRRVIVQRAPPPVIQKPRNIIIYYESPKAQIVRRFHNLGVQRANPTEYVARFGTQLEDSQSLLTRARQAGVTEDISPPGGTVSNFQSSSYENYQSQSLEAGAAAGSSSTGAYDVNAGLSTVGLAGGGSSGNYELSSSYNESSGTSDYTGGFESSFGNFTLTDNANNLAAGGSNNYETYSSQQTFTQ